GRASRDNPKREENKMETEFLKWAKKEGLLIEPEDGSVIDLALKRIRRQIEDRLRKQKRLILPVAKILGIKVTPWYEKGGL
ncbi:MAG: hypothetical protein V2B13_20415, partial [Pseudomonadota bacterium]